MSGCVEARGTDCARLIQVIETKALAGKGTLENPVRIKIQYWSLDGKLLADADTLEENAKLKKALAECAGY